METAKFNADTVALNLICELRHVVVKQIRESNFTKLLSIVDYNLWANGLASSHRIDCEQTMNINFL